jgi:MFS family permease
MGFFDRQETVADPGYNRWLFPPAALAVHLSIGQVYAFSVFKLPLTKIIGVTKSAPDNWSQPSLAWIFSLAIFFLGLPAAIFGRWVERVGPRKTEHFPWLSEINRLTTGSNFSFTGSSSAFRWRGESGPRS